MNEVVAPPHWRAVDFVSDLHLGADMPRTFAGFARHLRHTDADAVFLLGDVFELWIGDDTRHEGFAAACCTLLQEVSARTALYFMAGNRDFLVGHDLLHACGMTGLADPTLLQAFGQRVVLSHGDALCLDDVDYQRFRLVVRSAAWQTDFLAKSVQERAAIAGALRGASQERKRDQPDPSLWADVDTAAAVQLLHDHAAPTLVHGHTHRPGDVALPEGRVRRVLTDWDLDRATRAEVLRLDTQGFHRRAPATMRD